MKNEPQLSEEMEKRLEKFLTDTWGWSYEYGEWLDSESQPIGGIKDLKHFLATALEEQRATFVDEVKNRKATIKWLWGKQKTDDECFLMVMEQVQKIADILNGKE